MSKIYPWYDNEAKRFREDIWPFQKIARFERKETARCRLTEGVKLFVKMLPDGWSVQWRVKRGYDFRIESGRKLIKVPFPKTYAGTAAMATAGWLAYQIHAARAVSARDGSVPANHVSSFGFMRWRVNCGMTTVNLYDSNNNGLWNWGAILPYNRPAWRKASVSCAREMLRYLSTPDAWRLQRQTVRGPRLYHRHLLDRDVLGVIAYRKVLMDYIKVNDARYPLPNRAKALVAKASTPTQTPVSTQP
jgi:hypothetical protein